MIQGDRGPLDELEAVCDGLGVERIRPGVAPQLGTVVGPPRLGLDVRDHQVPPAAVAGAPLDAAAAPPPAPAPAEEAAALEELQSLAVREPTSAQDPEQAREPHPQPLDREPPRVYPEPSDATAGAAAAASPAAAVASRARSGDVYSVVAAVAHVGRERETECDGRGARGII